MIFVQVCPEYTAGLLIFDTLKQICGVREWDIVLPRQPHPSCTPNLAGSPTTLKF